jgi:hypothetical protein
MGLTSSAIVPGQPPTLIASSEARSLPTSQCRRRPNTGIFDDLPNLPFFPIVFARRRTGLIEPKRSVTAAGLAIQWFCLEGYGQTRRVEITSQRLISVTRSRHGRFGRL